MTTKPSVKRFLLLALLFTGAILLPNAQAVGQTGKDSAEATISRLSDQEVRELLLDELATGKEKDDLVDEEFNPAVIMYRLQRDIGRVSKELNAIFAALTELPAYSREPGRNSAQTARTVEWHGSF